jgi:PAS domain S-box-containing protein
MTSRNKTKKQLLDEIEELRRLRAEAEAAHEAAKRAEEALRASEMRFRSVAHTAVDAIISINSKDEVVFWNPAAQNIFGYAESEILGKSVAILIPERLRAAHSNGIKRYLQTGKPALIGRTAELHGLRKDGREFPLELSLATWETAEGIFFSGIIRDISNRKEVEGVLQQRTEEARQRTQELESLIQMVAHDLKSPLVSIGGLARLLRKGLTNARIDERTEQILGQLSNTSRTLEQFLKDLLDGLAIERSEPERMPFPLGDTVEDVVQQHKQASEDKGIRVRVEIANAVPHVLGDQHRIRQVIDNIVGNAIRHMGTNPKPAIRIQVLYEGNRVITRISDNGIGIPREFQAKVFDRFFRVPRADGQGGTGLGLSIVKKIVESHGGEIWVESEQGHGATFVFDLPRSEAAAGNPGGEDRPASQT